MTEEALKKEEKHILPAPERKGTDNDPGSFSAVMKRLCKDKSAVIALAVTLLYVAVAVFAEGYKAWCDAKKIEPVYMVQDHANRYAPPSWKHPMGTDYL